VLQKAAVLDNATVGVGITAGAGISGGGANISAGGSWQMVVSPNGDAALELTYQVAPGQVAGVGLGAGVGASLSFGSTFSTSTAATPQDLAGYGVNTDWTVTYAGVAVNYSATLGTGTQNQGVLQQSATIGFGLGEGVSVTAVYTNIWAFCKPNQ
jgi:hypothetical protein